MGRDYAARNKRPAARPAGLPGWVWACAGLSIGLVVAAWVYISRPPQPMPMATSPKLDEQAAPKPAIKIPPLEESRFSFYRLLPGEKVVTDAEVKSKGSTADETPYMIIVAAFKDPARAEEQKATLALSGIETKVQKAIVDDHETWYRVVIGPKKGVAQAQTVLSQLKTSGIEGRMIQQK
ncbi:MAG TPA: SPOR domain-containing protein [Nevskiaceae bacterium]|nr:SPOR domain-containing protein [Nevskiaceae bacterium]